MGEETPSFPIFSKLVVFFPINFLCFTTLKVKMSGKEEAPPENAQDLTIFVQNLLEQMVGFGSCNLTFARELVRLKVSNFLHLGMFNSPTATPVQSDEW